MENLELISIWDIDDDIQKKVMEKIINLKNLKKIKFEYGKIDVNELSENNGVNPNVKKLEIHWSKYNDELIMENLQNKFPNLSNLEIYIPRPKPGNEINLLITENKQSKINKFILSAGLYQNIKFYCTNFENLIEIKITLSDIIKNIENSFPLFNKDNNIIFKSLKILELKNKSENKIHISIIEAVLWTKRQI